MAWAPIQEEDLQPIKSSLENKDEIGDENSYKTFGLFLVKDGFRKMGFIRKKNKSTFALSKRNKLLSKNYLSVGYDTVCISKLEASQMQKAISKSSIIYRRTTKNNFTSVNTKHAIKIPNKRKESEFNSFSIKTKSVLRKVFRNNTKKRKYVHKPKCNYLQDKVSTQETILHCLCSLWVGVLWTMVFCECCVAFGDSRTVRTKYGDISGVIVTPDNRYLDAVEVFKGVPYASPPVGSLRFMPPWSGATWTGVKMANQFSPVCPQNFPDIKNETLVLGRMPRGRLEHLKRVLPYLRNQSEDCLYLNIYAPAHADLQGTSMVFPVLVYIHGESYMWGAGSLYDGSVLSSYGGLVVVTLNYRLGVLGFLDANPVSDQRLPANYGLLDQIAALNWVQKNIGYFGGDPGNVTLMGHGTGAACVHLLATSPAVPDGQLFKRVILMSGSALGPGAIVRDPLRHTRQVARHVGCPLDRNLLQCLRDRPLDTLLSAPVIVPAFTTTFGATVDGVIVSDLDVKDLEGLQSLQEGSSLPHSLNPNHSGNRKLMVSKMASYDLLLGMVKLESYFSFTEDDVQYGVEADRKSKIMRTFVRNNFRYHLSEILATIVNEYTDWDRPVQHPINIRDETMDAISDATVVAPMTRSADLHIRGSTFLYVFDYQTRQGDYPHKLGCVHGEEMPYVLGAPLVSSMMHFPRNFTKTEVQLSETIMDYFTNFIKTGDPNRGLAVELPLVFRIERRKTKNIEWLPYDQVHKRYLNLDMKPKMKHHYRAHRLSFWLNLVPTLHKPGGDDIPRSHHQLDFEQSFEETDTTELRSALNTSPPEVGSVPTSGNGSEDRTPGPEVVVALSKNSTPLRPHHDNLPVYATPFSVTITITSSLLALNIFVFILVFYKRKKKNQNSHHNDSMSSLASDNSTRKMENGGPMSTFCVTSGLSEMGSIETRISPLPILRDSCTDLRVLVLHPLQDVPLVQEQNHVDVKPPLPPKTSKLSSAAVTETLPLLSIRPTGFQRIQINDSVDQRV